MILPGKGDVNEGFRIVSEPPDSREQGTPSGPGKCSIRERKILSFQGKTDGEYQKFCLQAMDNCAMMSVGKLYDKAGLLFR